MQRRPALAVVSLVLVVVAIVPATTAASVVRRVASCPALGAHLAPDEARQIAGGHTYSVSPTLTRYAMAVAAASAKATPTVPPPSLVPIISEPAPKLGVVQQAAAACGYTGKVRAIVISASVSGGDGAAVFDVRVADPKLRGSAAIGVGAAFDRFGDLHIVELGGTVNDNNGSDPFASYSESKPAHPLPHPTGFRVIVYVDGEGDVSGAHISIYRSTRLVAHGVTDKQGVVNLVVPGPGRYTITGSFTFKGHHYTGKSVVPAMKGVMLPFTINACAPGEFGC